MQAFSTQFRYTLLAVLPLLSFSSHAENEQWFGMVSATFNDNYHQEDYLDDKSTDLSLNVGYHLTKQSDIYLSSAITYQNNDFCNRYNDDYWCMSNTYVYGSYKGLYQISDNIRLDYKARLLIPTSNYSKDSHLYTAIGNYVPISFNLTDFIHGLSISITPSFNKYFHQYKTYDGKNLVEYAFSTSLTSVYNINKWAFVLALTNSEYRTYQGDWKKPVMEVVAELDYQLTDAMGLAIGYSNNAQYYNPEQGRNPITDLFDDKDPYFYLSASYSF